MAVLHIAYEAPEHGWLTVTVTVAGKALVIDASDVPNNPVQDLIAALDAASQGTESCVSWPLEPDAYVTYLQPCLSAARLAA